MRIIVPLLLAGGLAAGTAHAGEIVINDHRAGRSVTIVEPHLRPGEMVTIRDPETGRTLGILEKPLRNGESLILRDFDTGIPIGMSDVRRDPGREAARAAQDARRQRVLKD
jgi:hypothetical protein